MGWLDAVAEARRPAGHLRLDLGRVHADELDAAFPTATEDSWFFRMPHGEHGKRHAEDGSRDCPPCHRYRGGIRRYRHRAETDGEPGRLRQNHPQRELNRRAAACRPPVASLAASKLLADRPDRARGAGHSAKVTA